MVICSALLPALLLLPLLPGMCPLNVLHAVLHCLLWLPRPLAPSLCSAAQTPGGSQAAPLHSPLR
jgi:hypothetical protein